MQSAVADHRDHFEAMLNQPHHFCVGQDGIALFGAIEYSLYALLGWLDAVSLEPEDDV
jgi:hypothetical protein